MLEGEGVRFVSGVEGVRIVGMGATDAEFGFRFKVEFGVNKFGLEFGLGGWVTLTFGADDDDDCCCSFLDPCERAEFGLRCVTKRWTR